MSILFFLFQSLWAQNLPFSSTAQLEILPAQIEIDRSVPGFYPDWVNWMMRRGLALNPNFQRQKTLLANCDSRELAGQIAAAAGSAQAQATLIGEFQSRCGLEIASPIKGELLQSLSVLFEDIEIRNHPYNHRVLFHLTKNIQLKGMLFVKPDLKPRPLVVVRTGIFGSLEQMTAERGMVAQIFEQGPFNLLMLESITGPEFISRNKRFSFGGVIEGIQNDQIAQILRDPKQGISRIVDSLHFMGISLGGHGVFLSAIMDAQRKVPLVDGFLNLCPVVNLKASMENMTAQGLQGTVKDMLFYARLSSLREIPKFPQYEKSWLAEGLSHWIFLEKIYEPNVTHFLESNWAEWQDFLSTNDWGRQQHQGFWQTSDFWSHLPNQPIRKPFLVFATQTDHFVPWELNGKKLATSQFAEKNKLGFVLFEQGAHCTFTSGYRWPFMADVFQAVLLSQAKGKLMEKQIFVPLSADQVGHLQEDIQYLWPPGESSVILDWGRGVQTKIALQDLDGFSGNRPISVFEQKTWQRWLQQQLNANIDRNGPEPRLKISWRQWQNSARK